MSPDEDLDATLQALERRLRELERDLGDPAAEPPAATAAAADPLDQFGVELRRLAGELVAAWDRVVAQERGPGRHRIVLEAQTDLDGLAALHRALAAAPTVRTLDLRAYAGGHASLLVEVS